MNGPVFAQRFTVVKIKYPSIKNTILRRSDIKRN